MINKAKILFVQQMSSYSILERFFWSLLLATLLLVLSWRLIWIPATTSLEVHIRAYHDAAEAAEWFGRSLPDIASLFEPTNSAHRLDFNLTQWVSQTSQAHSLEFSRFEPVGDESLRIWLDEQDFMAFTQWLSEITTQGLLVRDLRISKGQSIGTADVVMLITEL